MPLYIGSTKISDIVLTDSNGTRRNISEARISNDTGTLSRAVFPDSVGAPLIEEFNLPATVSNSAAGFSVSVTIVGTEDATYELSPSANSSVTGGNTGTIPSSGTVNRTWVIEANTSTSSRNFTLGIAATGSSSTEGINRTSLPVVQSGAIANPITLSGFPPNNYLSGSPVAVNSTVFGDPVNNADIVTVRVNGAAYSLAGEQEANRYTYVVRHSGQTWRFSSSGDGGPVSRNTQHLILSMRGARSTNATLRVTISRPGYTTREQIIFT